jgi:tetratricopeptide (TPR) repeat protein
MLVIGCAARAPEPQTGAPPEEREPVAKPRQKLVLEPIQLQVRKGPGGPTVEVLEATALFERAGQLLSAKRYRQAIGTYDKLLEHFPTSRFVSPSLYNAGLCHEWLGDFRAAARRYKELIGRFGHTKEAVDAAFRLGGCYAELRSWPASAQVFAAVLKRKDLSATDRIEAMARQGLAYFRMGDERRCRTTLQAAISYHEDVEAVERIDTDFFLAMAHYYLAALPHVDFRALEVQAGSQLATTLDEKARLLLLAQARYIRAINVKNPYWATAAGFQIGSLYREFYRVLLTTLPDFEKQATKNARRSGTSKKEAQRLLVQVYLEEVHKAVKPLLAKAIRVFEKNLHMAERVGVASNWVGKSRQQVQELKHILSLPPKEAVKLVVEDKTLPEDKPAVEQDPEDKSGEASPRPEQSEPAAGSASQPTAPEEPETDETPAPDLPPPAETPDVPGRAIL